MDALGIRRHTVRFGDTLMTIADTYYGNPRLFGYIYRANDKYIDNPNVLAVGQVLVIPHLPLGESIEATLRNLLGTNNG